MYADDIILIAETEDDLQKMLDTLSIWSNIWRMEVNPEKTKVMHCRKSSVAATNNIFKLGEQNIKFCKTYRYLGFEVSETVDFVDGVKTLHEAGSRALGAIISKHYSSKGLSFPVFEKLYFNTVVPVTDYASEVWGYKTYDFADKIQFRAIRTQLGVGKRAPLPYLSGETGWLDTKLRRQLNMIRLWLRVINMPENRIPKKIFSWDKQNCRKNNWASEVKAILEKCDLLEYYQESSTLGLSEKTFLDIVKEKLFEICSEKWKNEVISMPKLRTYVKLKDDYSQELILGENISIKQRSAISKFLSGTFPIEIEIGRYRSKPISERLCKTCSNSEIEDEMHFLMQCSTYRTVRSAMINIVEEKLDIHSDELNKDELFKILLTTPEIACDVANYLISALNKRSSRV